MNIANIDIDYIEFFSLCYEMAKNIYEVEPVDATPKMQRKIRKWFDKTYLKNEELSVETENFIDKDMSDLEFIQFLKECYDYIQANGTEKKQRFDKFACDLSEEVKSVIWDLVNSEFFCDDIQKTGDCVQINVDFCDGYDRVLTLMNVSGVPEKDYDQISFENGSLEKVNDTYVLAGEVENYEDETTRPFAISFTDAKVDVVLYNSTAQSFNENPWCHLQSVAGSIVDKHSLSEKYLNDKEKEIFPLCAEISRLSYWAFMEQGTQLYFPKLKSYISKHGFDELLLLIEKMENNLDDKQRDKAKKNLVNKLNMKKYEPLWREVYELIADSQKEYPERVSAFCSAEQLNEERAKIQVLMEAHGYSGKYPDFVKCGSLSGVRLAESYDISYFVARQKNVAYHIHCTEEYFCEHLRIEFLCGTQILKKNESVGDIYSCLFNSKGKSFFKTAYYESGFIDDDGEEKSDNLESRVQIAVKRAELKKLTKEEYKEIEGFILPFWKTFLLFFTLMGGLFAVFMTPAFMFIEVLSCVIVGQANMIPEVFLDTPWWMIFSFCWISFGGAMGLITALVKTRR